jgi:hypothetical protein
LTDRTVFHPGTTDVTTSEPLLGGAPAELGATSPDFGTGWVMAAGAPETATVQLVDNKTAAHTAATVLLLVIPAPCRIARRR